MELWGGHECTVNRVRTRYRDQTRLTGHQDRIEDLARFAALGITKLRYPVLWERVAPDRPDRHDWAWSDERLREIARLSMTPIVGLLHHGSGPRYTSLVADDFAPLFGQYADAVARRYPDVGDWTPVNEPLTTARFSALYGHWYPHDRDERQFWLALLNQVDGTRAAMAAIRRINPAARLVQTDDLARYYATESLSEQCEHHNHRRWASWDLLTGRFGREHPLWSYVEQMGFGERLRAIADDPCPPDVLGVNYYPTSERFLDDRLEGYPDAPPEVGYHDVAAVRVMDPPPVGLAGLLREAWDRYRLPLAVTETHLGCTREEQLRWLWQSWRICGGLRQEGVDVRAVTAWALLGNKDWNSLITVEADHYEPGAFDVRGPEPRPTAIARLLATLAREPEAAPQRFPELAEQGWWNRPNRLEHVPFAWSGAATPISSPEARPIVITGATGTLGQALARECDMRGLSYRLTDRAALPIEDAGAVAAYLDTHRPWAVINAAGWVRVDDAEEQRDACMTANGAAAGVLAAACAERGIHCTLFSSDLVFDGEQREPYLEADAPRPLNVYGESKAQAEALSVGRFPETLLVRTAAFFSPHDEHNFAVAVERTLRSGHAFLACPDAVVTPTLVGDLVRATVDLVVDREGGIWHLTNGTAVSWYAFAQMIAVALDLDTDMIQPADAARLGWRAVRPRQAALESSRGALLPSLADAVARHAFYRKAALTEADGRTATEPGSIAA